MLLKRTDGVVVFVSHMPWGVEVEVISRPAVEPTGSYAARDAPTRFAPHVIWLPKTTHRDADYHDIVYHGSGTH